MTLKTTPGTGEVTDGGLQSTTQQQTDVWHVLLTVPQPPCLTRNKMHVRFYEIQAPPPLTL